MTATFFKQPETQTSASMRLFGGSLRALNCGGFITANEGGKRHHDGLDNLRFSSISAHGIRSSGAFI